MSHPSGLADGAGDYHNERDGQFAEQENAHALEEPAEGIVLDSCHTFTIHRRSWLMQRVRLPRFA